MHCIVRTHLNFAYLFIFFSKLVLFVISMQVFISKANSIPATATCDLGFETQYRHILQATEGMVQILKQFVTVQQAIKHQKCKILNDFCEMFILKSMFHCYFCCKLVNQCNSINIYYYVVNIYKNNKGGLDDNYQDHSEA